MEKFRILGVRKSIEEEKGKEVVGFADVEITGVVKILNIKILETRSGDRYCALPSLPFFSRQLNKRIFRSTVHILNPVLKEMIYNSILQEFKTIESLKFQNEGGLSDAVARPEKKGE
jgi:DNA-binding cell septation regulator SpoVG